MAAVTIYSDFGARKSKVCHCFNCFSIYLPWSDGTGLPWSLFSDCWALSQLFHSLLSLSSRGSLALHFCHKGGVTCISEVFDISLEIFIPACASSSPTFLMMYSAYKLNKHSDNIQPWCTPCPIWNQSVVPCPVLTVAPWPAYRFLRRQVRWLGIPISLIIFHSLLWSTQSKALA